MIHPLPPLTPPQIVTSLHALQALAARLQDEDLVAVDTEANSLFAYRERVCLIQLSTRTEDWIIDPLAIQDMTPLAPLFASPHTQKVFHAAEYDVMCLKRDFDFTFANLFDTMLAARILGLKSVGLASMLEAYFGIRADKRFQRANWMVRPIPADQLAYAQEDAHYLPALRDILLERLQQEGYWEEALESFALLSETQPTTHQFDPDGYWYITAARDFTRREMAILRELFLLREQVARGHDQPPFRVMSDNVLCSIVRARLRHVDDLAKVRGLGRNHVERYGYVIMRAIQQGRTARLPLRPDRSPRIDAATLARYNALHEWRKARARKRGVESDVILPKDALWALARSVPQSPDDLLTIPGLGPWKRAQYGAELLTLLANVEIPE
jgi:ribonuclease D